MKIEPTRASDGQRRLAVWLAQTRTTMRSLASALGVSSPTVYAWKVGTKSPRRAHALALEQQTGGAVRVSDWMTDEERAELGPRAA